MDNRQHPMSAEKSGYAAEAAWFFLCGRCGQYVDRRRADDVRHHQRLSHKALDRN